MAATTKISASCLVVSTLNTSLSNSRKAVATVLSVVTTSPSARRSRVVSASCPTTSVLSSNASKRLNSSASLSLNASISAQVSKSRFASASIANVAKLTSSGTRNRTLTRSLSAVATVASRVKAQYSASASFEFNSSFLSSLTAGDVLIQTDQNGQNTHVCIGDSVVFNFTVVKSYIARKAIFAMKRSKNSTNGCMVAIYDQAYGQGNVVASSFIPVSEFSQQWTDMTYVFNASLEPDTTYSLVVSSTTSCNDNNDSFFIKAGAIEIVDMANGVVISNGYSIQTKKPKCVATVVATATRIRNANSFAHSLSSFNSYALRDRAISANCLLSSSMDGQVFRDRVIQSNVESNCEFDSAAQLLASVVANAESLTTSDFELTGGIVADNLILNYNLVQPESFEGEGSDTIYDIVMNSDMKLFPKPSIQGLNSPNAIGHWDLTQGLNRRAHANFPFYLRKKYGRKNDTNRIEQVGPYFSDFGFGTIRFNAIDSYAVTINDLAEKFNSNKVSVFMWVYPTRDGVLLSEQGSFVPNENWHASQIEIVDGSLKFGIWSDGGLISLNSSIPIEYFHWYYVGLTYDGSKMKGYISGQPAGSVNVIRSTPYENGYGLYYCLGHETSTNMGDGRYGGMRFGQMHLYSDSLTDEEVHSNWYNTRARYEDPEHYAKNP